MHILHCYREANVGCCKFLGIQQMSPPVFLALCQFWLWFVNKSCNCVIQQCYTHVMQVVDRICYDDIRVEILGATGVAMEDELHISGHMVDFPKVRHFFADMM